jgi:hypothetical protein
MNGNSAAPDVAPDRAGSSIVRDHPFVERARRVQPDGWPVADRRMLPPTRFLCGVCRLAEAAHTQTTVTRGAS